MKRAELEVDHPRLGWFDDGLPEDVTPSTAVMLLDDGSRISLTIPWLRGRAENLERMFRGPHVSYGDDPDRTRYIYELPRQMIFFDVDGPISLVGCQPAGHQEQLGSGAGQGIVNVTAVVVGGRSREYNKLNGLRSYVQDLGYWAGLTSLTETREHHPDGRLRGYKLELAAPEPIHLLDNLNLAIAPDWSSRVDATEVVREVRDECFIRTESDTAVEWETHLESHLIVRDLLDVCSWQPTGYMRQTVNRSDDPLRFMSGEPETFPRWLTAKTYSIRAATPRTRRPAYMFGWADLETKGFSKWVALRSRYIRGIRPVLSLLNDGQRYVETQLLQSAIGLEAIGYQLAIDQGRTRGDANRMSMQQRLELLEKSLTVQVVSESWPQRSADAYNGVKHANRAIPDVQAMLNTTRENVLVFRCWVALNLGLDPSHVAQSITHTDYAQYLLRQGAIPHPQARALD